MDDKEFTINHFLDFVKKKLDEQAEKVWQRIKMDWQKEETFARFLVKIRELGEFTASLTQCSLSGSPT